MSKVKVWGYGGGKNGLKQEEAVVKGGKHTIRKLCAKRGGIEKVLLTGAAAVVVSIYATGTTFSARLQVVSQMTRRGAEGNSRKSVY